MKATILLDVPEEAAKKCSQIAGIPVTLNDPHDAEIQIGMRRFVPTTSLKMVQTVSAGVDHLNFREFDHSVLFCSNAGAFSDSVAQHAFALILSQSNKICHFNSEIRAGRYSKEPVITVRGLTLGILGYGGIGQSCARIARGLEMKVIAYTRSRKEDGLVDSYTDSSEELMKISDIVIIALPLTSKTRGIVNLKLLKSFRGSIIVNVARADIVDRNDMEKFLKENRNVFYLTDVWWNEPAIQLPLPENVVLTPHVAGISQDSMESALLRACENVRRYIDGQPGNVVNVSEYL